MFLSRVLLSLSLLSLVAAAPAKPRTNQPNSYDLQLTWTPFGFIGNISIGSPAQEVAAFVDWTWIGQYAFTQTCHGDRSKTYDCLSKEQLIFNQSESSTFVNQSALYPSRTWNPNHFFFYDDLSVDYASDILTVGPSSTRITIQAADMHFDLTEEPYPFTGVYGLSPVFKSDNASTQSPFYQAWAAGAWPKPLVAFHYCYNGSVDTTKATCKGADGLQTLGSINEELIDGDVSWYDVEVFPPVNDVDFVYEPPILNYWSLKMTQLRLGDEVMALNESTGAGAIFDHASYGRGAPLSVDAYDRLVQTSGATPITLEDPLAVNNGNQSFYRVDCNKTAELPPIRYQFAASDKEWEIIPANYVDDFGNGTCVLNVRTLGFGDMIAGNFGETFAKDKYVIFDFEKLKVGLADLKW